MAETGKKLAAKLHAQRRYLRTEYDKVADVTGLAGRQDFVRSLAGMASFMESTWNVRDARASRFGPLTVTDNEAIVGLEALKDLKHSITIAPISRFFQSACLEPQDEGRVAELIAAVKATVRSRCCGEGVGRYAEYRWTLPDHHAW